VLTNFGNFPQMVEGSAANFSDVLLHGEMCVQGNAKVANGVRRGNGRVTEQKRNVRWFKFAGFRIADQSVGFWVVNWMRLSDIQALVSPTQFETIE